jgi:hypothetical protein
MNLSEVFHVVSWLHVYSVAVELAFCYTFL